MPRSQDLDTIAPDDPVEVTPVTPPPSVKPILQPPVHLNPTDNQPEQGYVLSPADFNQKVYDILGHTKSPFSAFLVRPDIFSFAEKGDNEEIILVLRPHWFNNLSWIVISILTLFFPLFLPYVPLLNGFPARYQLVAVMFWYLIIFAYAFEKFLSWYFNVSIITSQRVVDIDFYNLLDKKFSEAGISVIQDVTSRISGVSQTNFYYGTVLIQTASEVNEIVFGKIPNPNKVVKILSELRQQDHLVHNHHDS